MARLATSPEPVEVPGPGGAMTLEVTAELFAGAVRLLVYGGPLTAQLPRVVTAAEAGDVAPLMQVVTPFVNQLATGLYLGMTFAVICTEDAPFIDLADAARRAEGTFLGSEINAEVKRACAAWPRGALPEGYSKHVRSDIPTLLISAEADPVTPPSRAVGAAAMLSRSLHVIVPNSGHLGNVQACEIGIITQFIDAGHGDGVDVACARARPPRRFVLP